MNRHQRTGHIVWAVVFGHFLLVSVQVGSGLRGSALEDLAFHGFSEMQRLLTSTSDTAVRVWSRYVDLRNVRVENEKLTRTVANLQLLLQEQQAQVQQVQGLRSLLGLRQTVDLRTVGARVIATSATPYVRTVTVDRGAEDGVHAEAAVIAPGGVVGRVVGAPAPRAARVQLLVDRLAAVGARVGRTRVAGVVTAGDDATELRMEYVANHEDVRSGDRVVTSGTDGIYPAGFAIGTVTAVAPGSELDLSIEVFPAVEFSRLEDVLIVVSEGLPPVLAVASE